jgi:hypothetical protein
MAVTIAATVALAACGSDSKDSSSTSTPPPAATTPSNVKTTATTTPSTSGPEATAPDSASLALGTRVVAPYVVYGKTGERTETKVAVTVKKVRKGSISDFKDFNLDAKQKATVPYYVDVKYENLGELKLQRFLLDPSIEDSDGTEYKPINLIVLSGTFKQCPEPSRARLRPGKSFELCAPILVPKGKTFERVRFQGDVTKDPYFWK